MWVAEMRRVGLAVAPATSGSMLLFVATAAAAAAAAAADDEAEYEYEDEGLIERGPKILEDTPGLATLGLLNTL